MGIEALFRVAPMAFAVKPHGSLKSELYIVLSRGSKRVGVHVAPRAFTGDRRADGLVPQTRKWAASLVVSNSNPSKGKSCSP